jgi:hypothetical protein
MMEIPEYVTKEEVKDFCQALNIRDWTTLTEAKVLPDEARIILAEVNQSGLNVDLKDFRVGLEVELEHGLYDTEVNVTNNHPLLTGRIVLAHLKESLDYYKRLEVAELEGDLLKAIVTQNSAKILKLYPRLAQAKLALAQAQTEQLG